MDTWREYYIEPFKVSLCLFIQEFIVFFMSRRGKTQMTPSMLSWTFLLHPSGVTHVCASTDQTDWRKFSGLRYTFINSPRREWDSCVDSSHTRRRAFTFDQSTVCVWHYDGNTCHLSKISYTTHWHMVISLKFYEFGQISLEQVLQRIHLVLHRLICEKKPIGNQTSIKSIEILEIA